MKILVTGGGGFLGGYIVDMLLRRGEEVVTLQRGAYPQLERKGVKVVRGALTDVDAVRAAMRGCDTVIHTAAKAGVAGRAKDFFQTNLEGSLVVRDVMAELGIRRLVHCSTPSVVFTGESFEGADESLPYGRNWLCAYAESKALAEAALLEWGRNSGARVIALRPHLIWGTGDPHLLPRVMERARRGRLRIVGDGCNKVDITRVENAAAAHLLAVDALENDAAVNRPYFISQGEPVVLWDWVNDMLALAGIERLSKRVPLRTAYRIGAVCERIWGWMAPQAVPPMTRFVAVELAKSHWFSISSAREHLGYRPECYPTVEGMQAYIKNP